MLIPPKPTLHRDHLNKGCIIAASAADIGRQSKKISTTFTDGFADVVKVIEGMLEQNGPSINRRQRALAIGAAMVGGISVARATVKANPNLSDDILVAVRNILLELVL